MLVPCRATGCRLYQPPLRHSAEQKPLLSLPEYLAPGLSHSSFTAPGQSLGATCCSCERASPALRAVTQTGQGYCTVSWSGAQGTKGTDRLLAAYGKMLGVTGRDWSPGSGSLLPWPPVALTAFPAVTGHTVLPLLHILSQDLLTHHKRMLSGASWEHICPRWLRKAGPEPSPACPGGAGPSLPPPRCPSWIEVGLKPAPWLGMLAL